MRPEKSLAELYKEFETQYNKILSGSDKEKTSAFEAWLQKNNFLLSIRADEAQRFQNTVELTSDPARPIHVVSNTSMGIFGKTRITTTPSKEAPEAAAAQPTSPHRT